MPPHLLTVLQCKVSAIILVYMFHTHAVCPAADNKKLYNFNHTVTCMLWHLSNSDPVLLLYKYRIQQNCKQFAHI